MDHIADELMAGLGIEHNIEASIVRPFMEAKRHQPLVVWCTTIPETAHSAVRAMSILSRRRLSLGMSSLGLGQPRKSGEPRASRRTEARIVFEGVLPDVQHPPNEFAGGVERNRRVLDVLPIALPLIIREPTVDELAVQEESDQCLIVLLQHRFGPILSEPKRKFKH